MILPINHIENWRHICQRKQSQIEKDVTCKNSTRINFNFNIGDKVIVGEKKAYKYETSFKGPYEIVQTWTNGTVTILTGAVTVQLNIIRIKPYNSPEIE